jgi:hypothetical protein
VKKYQLEQLLNRSIDADDDPFVEFDPSFIVVRDLANKASGKETDEQKETK